MLLTIPDSLSFSNINFVVSVSCSVKLHDEMLIGFVSKLRSGDVDAKQVMNTLLSMHGDFFICRYCALACSADLPSQPSSDLHNPPFIILQTVLFRIISKFHC